MFGAWTFGNIWNLLFSSFSVATLIGIAAAAVAVASPPFLSALIPNLRWIAVYVAIGAFTYTFVSGKFYHDGLTAKQSKWDAALAREAANGEAARTDVSVLLLATLLTACAPTRATVTTGNRVADSKARCSGWRAISFSAKGDTTRTVEEVRSHNATGKNKKCWR